MYDQQKIAMSAATHISENCLTDATSLVPSLCFRDLSSSKVRSDDFGLLLTVKQALVGEDGCAFVLSLQEQMDKYIFIWIRTNCHAVDVEASVGHRNEVHN